MDKDGTDQTTINVKGVSAAEWKRAGKLADRNGESRGAWLTRAVKLLADMEEGAREFGPSEPVKPRKELATPEQMTAVAALLQGVAANRGNRHQAAVDLRRLADEMAREALGLDPIPVRTRFFAANRPANLGHHSRQSALIDAAPTAPPGPE